MVRKKAALLPQSIPWIEKHLVFIKNLTLPLSLNGMGFTKTRYFIFYAKNFCPYLKL
jgi:hypothetical protein